MSALFTEVGLMTYEKYIEQFEHWVANHQSSKPGASDALIEFTKINLARTHRLHKTLQIKPGLKQTVQSIKHTYSLVVLTEAWCGDSAQNLPLIAELAALNPEKLKLFILLRDENHALMDNYLTNGARAIPKLIVINETLGQEEFVWGPRPAPAQELLIKWKANPQGKSWHDFEKDLHSWYAKDKMQTLQEEMLQLTRGLQ